MCVMLLVVVFKRRRKIWFKGVNHASIMVRCTIDAILYSCSTATTADADDIKDPAPALVRGAPG
jgi:hypothetical protein